jgi:hypothetical protein
MVADCLAAFDACNLIPGSQEFMSEAPNILVE